MSVSLTPISQLHLDDPETFDVANLTWGAITRATSEVTPWNGYHNSVQYTPEELLAMAAKNPEYAKQLQWLASEGGAELG